MTIIGIVGPMGSGKTLVMTKILNDSYIEGSKVYSNYSLKFPHTIITVKDIEDYAAQKKDLFDVTIGLSEIYLYVDSRLSGTKKNRIYSYFALQTSKRDVKLVWDAQNFHSVDKRIRDNTHILKSVTPVLIIGRKVRPFQSWKRILPKKYYRYFYVMVDTIYRTGMNYKEERSFVKASKVFGMYDTRQVIRFDGA